ncbi:MAG: hypothetical protein ABSF45_09580, partial [Terriglobia bacterium]
EAIDIGFGASQVGFKLRLHLQDKFNLLVHLFKRHGASSGMAFCHDPPWNEVITNPSKKKMPMTGG